MARPFWLPAVALDLDSKIALVHARNKPRFAQTHGVELGRERGLAQSHQSVSQSVSQAVRQSVGQSMKAVKLAMQRQPRRKTSHERLSGH